MAAASSTHSVPKAGSDFPKVTVTAFDGSERTIGGSSGKWQVVVVWRHKVCPICVQYLGGAATGGLPEKFKGVDADLTFVTMDSVANVAEFTKANSLESLDMTAALSEADARSLGLFISSPWGYEVEAKISSNFAEPGLFVVNPEGKLHIVDVSNAPFARPDLSAIVGGLAFVQGKGYPIRGTA